MTCPHPDKAVYRSERAAKDALKGIKRSNRDGPGFLHAYRCGAHWHLGHGHKTRWTVKGKSFR